MRDRSVVAHAGANFLSQNAAKNLEEALECYKDAVRLFQQAFGPDTTRPAFIFGKMARVYESLKRFDDEAEYSGKAIEAFKREKGEMCRDVACLLGNKGISLKNQGKNSEAMEVMLAYHVSSTFCAPGMC